MLGQGLGGAEAASRAVRAAQNLPQCDIECAQPGLRRGAGTRTAVAAMQALRSRRVSVCVPDCMRERSVLRRQKQRYEYQPQECAAHRTA